MRRFVQFVFVFIAIFAAPFAAQAKVRISVNLSSQRMQVSAANGASYSWPISSARSGYVTPRGTYSPISLQTMHRSKKYHNSPMPHSIFFAGGYAIHGTYATGSLGHPASHGCVRISPANAATLFSLVRAEGATISISGSPPASRPFAHEHNHHHHYAGLHHHHHYAGFHHRHYAGLHRHGSSALSYAPNHSHDLEGIFGSVLRR